MLDGSEKVVSVDGFLARAGQPSLIIEINGCWWHGCSKCYPDRYQTLPNGLTVWQTAKKTADRKAALEAAGHEVEEIWECQILAELKENPEMKAFFNDEQENAGPIRLRDAFHGGRTMAVKLRSKADDKTKLTFVDVQSLYPHILVSRDMPTCTPEVINYTQQDINWTKPEDVPFFGLFKVLVVPPRGLRHPVLPMKVCEKLSVQKCLVW